MRLLSSASEIKTHRCGGWLTKDNHIITAYLMSLRERAAPKSETDIVEPVKQLDNAVRSDPVLFRNAEAMFHEAKNKKSLTPLGTKSVQNWGGFIQLLNHIVVNIAPEFYYSTGTIEALGLVGFPINSLLNWPMGTVPGYAVFSNPKFNTYMRSVLKFWTHFLLSPNSRYTLAQASDNLAPSLAWLHPKIQEELVKVVNQAHGSAGTVATFPEVFQCDPEKYAYGFAHWDAFFIRDFKEGIRLVDEPDDDNIIVSACEAAPLQVVCNASLTDTFWLKEQPYSLRDMIDYKHNTFANNFDGGTVYQGFLSALSYHRWKSPVAGTVVAAYNIPGTYFLQNYNMGFNNSSGADSNAPNESQPYIANVATRLVIIIKADNPRIGLMAFIGIGMAEVSSCESYVQAGSIVNKGDPIGTFHFGGSTHCLIFRKNVNINFIDYIKNNYGLSSANIAISSKIAEIY